VACRPHASPMGPSITSWACRWSQGMAIRRESVRLH
jgi:hypothetical protein